MQIALNVKIKERTGEWLIGANTQNVPYLSIVVRQDKTKQRSVRRLLISVKVCRCASAQGT